MITIILQPASETGRFLGATSLAVASTSSGTTPLAVAHSEKNSTCTVEIKSSFLAHEKLLFNE